MNTRPNITLKKGYHRNETDLRYIQEWLGHESSKTTEIYTHVSKLDFDKFSNPLDEMFADSG